MSRKLEVMKAVIAAWTAGDIDAVMAHLHPDIVWRPTAAVAPPPGFELIDRPAI